MLLETSRFGPVHIEVEDPGKIIANDAQPGLGFAGLEY